MKPADRTPSAASTTAAKPCGTCARCGGTLYEYLTHFCTTSFKLSNQSGGLRLTPWGTWEWRPW
jgi:hypothetical protein